ncbi:MAG: twin-arginine translocase subunit TatC [Anaerolineales bacterium]|nr:twin-arginine translocase subunit TatC [Anaerolineales bacterium]
MRARLNAFWRTITAPFRFLARVLRFLFGWIPGYFRDLGALFHKDENIDDAPVVDALGKAIENPSSVLEHLVALRKHLFRATVALFLAISLTFAFSERLLNLLAEPIGGIDALKAVEVTESVGVFMRVSMLTGFAIALPYIALEFLLFAAPGLTRRERFLGLASIPLIAMLFLAGMAFTYFILLPPAVNFLSNFIFQLEARPESYYSFALALMFWLGASFEFPLIVYVLVSMGLIQAHVLRDQARIAIVIVALFAAAITPTTDIINMLLVWVPLIGVYYIGVALAFVAQRGRDRNARKA